MNEERTLNIDGYKVSVVISGIEPINGKFRAIASFPDYDNSLFAAHDHKDKEIAVEGAITKLFVHGYPDILKHL